MRCLGSRGRGLAQVEGELVGERDAARRRRRASGAARRPPRRRCAGGRRRTGRASRPCRRGCAAPAPRPSPRPAGPRPGWRGGRCRRRRRAARGRRPARPAASLVSSAAGCGLGESSTATWSIPNRRVSRSSSSAAAGRPVGGQGRAHRPLAAAGQHQPVAAPALGQLGQVVDRAALLVAAQVRVGHRRGEPVVALDAAGQHQQVVPLGVGYAVLRAAQPQRELGAVDGPQPGGRVGRRRLGQHRRAVEAVVVGDRQAVQPEPDRLLHQLRRRRRAVEEAEVAVAVQLGVRRPRGFGIGRRRRGARAGRACAARPARRRRPGSPESRRSSSFQDIAGLFQPISRSPPRPASRPARRAAARPGRRRRPPGTARTAPPPDHHDSSTGQGPAQAATGCQPPSQADPARLAADHPALGHHHGPPGLVAHLGGDRLGEDPAGRRPGQPPRPRPVERPQRGGALAPRHRGLPVGGAAPALEHRPGHGVEPHHRLDPGHPALHQLLAGAAPQPLGVRGRRLHDLGQEPHPLDRRPHQPRVVARAQRAAGLELPVHPVDEVARGEELRVQPGARRGDRPVVLGLDPDPGGHQLPRRQVGDQPLGRRADAEADRLHRVERRLEGAPRRSGPAAGCGVRRASAPPHGPGATPARRSGRSGAAPRRPGGPRGRRGCAARGGAAG